MDISINTKGFTLKTREEGNPGWYLPDKLRLSSMGVHVLIPVFTKVELTSVGTETYDFKIYTEICLGKMRISLWHLRRKGKLPMRLMGRELKLRSPGRAMVYIWRPLIRRILNQAKNTASGAGSARIGSVRGTAATGLDNER